MDNYSYSRVDENGLMSKRNTTLVRIPMSLNYYFMVTSLGDGASLLPQITLNCIIFKKKVQALVSLRQNI